MRALVTGGAGFIGSHIVDALLRDGLAVRILDSLDPKVHPHGKPPYLPSEAEFIHGDVCDKTAWRRALRDTTVVFHEAAYQDYLTDYSRFLAVNSVSTALMYEVIAETRMDVQKVVVASSQAVYGEGQYECGLHGLVEPAARPREQLDRGQWEVQCPQCGHSMKPLGLKEEHANPFNPYALSKHSQEMVALRLGRMLGVPSVALRYSITQGPRQSLYNQYSGVSRIFTLRLLNDEPPIVFEDGLQTRDFVHVKDVVAANLLVLKDSRADFQAFNVGSGRPTTILEYAEKLARKLSKDISVQLSGEYRLGDNRHSVSDISKLRLLGWEPVLSLDDILSDFTHWVCQQSLQDVDLTMAREALREAGVVRKVRDGTE